MKNRLLPVIAVLATGLMCTPAVAGYEDFINQSGSEHHLETCEQKVTACSDRCDSDKALPECADKCMQFSEKCLTRTYGKPAKLKELPPDAKKEIDIIIKLRASAYQKCRVHAEACAINCGKRYREKNRQALCFSAGECAAKWDNCTHNVLDKYPLDTLKVIKRLKGKNPE